MSNDHISGYRLGYRSDIEGLRAVAILLVVAAHAGVPWLTGGFVGVDVFFVLSGYLITGLIVQEIRTSGDFGFARFYARRLRRLLPALLLMLFVTCLAAWALLPVSSLLQQANSAGNASVWMSNFYFAFTRIGYFSLGAKSNLFLHTWSLGVEEQFYLVWPLLILILSGVWKGAKKPPNPGRLNLAMPLVFTASLLLCLLWSYQAPHLAFYMMPSRAWQFALGALVFMLFGSPRAHWDITQDTAIKRNMMHGMGWLGLLMILVAAVVLDGNMVYPGYWALLPTFGAALVIAAGARSQNAGAARVLSGSAMQGIGRVSYAWYLWHWPILLLGAAVLNSHNDWIQFGLVVLSLLAAIASYHLVEKPIRHAKRLLTRPRMAVVSGLLLMIIAVGLVRTWDMNTHTRMSTPVQTYYRAAHADAPVIYSMGCDAWYFNAKVHPCRFGSAHATHTVVALGDSIGLQWFPAIAKIFDKPGWQLIVLTKSSCPMVDAPIFYGRIGRVYKKCSTWRSRVIRKLAAIKPDIVLLGSTYTYHYSRKQWITGTRDLLRKVSNLAGHVYMLRSTPTLPFDGPQCMAPRSKLYRWLKGKHRCTSPAHSQHFDDVFAWRQKAAESFYNVTSIDMTDTVCPHDLCKAQQGKIVAFRDGQHMTASFAKSIAPSLASHIELRASNHQENRLKSRSKTASNTLAAQANPTHHE